MYLVNDWQGRWILKVIDAFLKAIHLFRQQALVRPFRKILICNTAHLGDVVLSTSVLPWISECYPEAKIGFLAGSWSRELLLDHVYVDRVHTIDHWKLDRSSRTRFDKFIRYLAQRKRLLKELKEENYDLAIDLYPFFPNAIPWLSKVGIPVRVGYTSGGFSPCLTHPMTWEEKGQGIVRHFQDLLSLLALPQPIELLLPSLIYNNSISSSLPRQPYCLFHVGSGMAKKEWSVEKWQELTKRFKKKGLEVVFSGRGAREKEMIARIAKEGGGVDLCDKLSLRQLVEVVERAKLVVTVDSVTAHLASAFKIPIVVLFSGINPIELWAPSHAETRRVFTKPPCFPCLKKEGCSLMSCIQGIGVDEVMEAVCSLGL